LFEFRDAGYFFSVILIGGASHNEGNVYAFNPSTSIFGAVCDDTWTQKNVRKFGFAIPI
jgi:hypothetical protein